MDNLKFYSFSAHYVAAEYSVKYDAYALKHNEEKPRKINKIPLDLLPRNNLVLV